MPQLKNVQDLDKLREEAQRLRNLRIQTGTTITIGTGTCGIAAGARDTMRAIQEELEKRQIDARVVTVGCIGICIKEPLVDIQQGGGPKVFYANVRPEMVPRLIEQHLVKGQPVREWAIGRMPAE